LYAKRTHRQEEQLRLDWPFKRYVEEGNDPTAREGDKIFVDDAVAELERAAMRPIGVFGVGYPIPELLTNRKIYEFAEALRVRLGFERVESDLVQGGVLRMHRGAFDRFSWEVPGTDWRLEITIFAKAPVWYAAYQPDYLLFIGSGSVMNRLLQPQDVLQYLLPFVRDELEPALRRFSII
jgi:hypothetical protein